MAMSPAGRVPSLTRSGDLDPEVVLRVVEGTGGVSAARTLLNNLSGVAGLSGGRTDVRGLLAAGDAPADLALAVFARAVAMAVAGAVTVLNEWQTLVFTGGIGTGSAELRERVCSRLLPLRPGAAALPGIPSGRLVASGVRVLVVPVDEEAVMDRSVRALPPRGALSRATRPAAGAEQRGAPAYGTAAAPR
jgi:acetate kinase